MAAFRRNIQTHPAPRSKISVPLSICFLLLAIVQQSHVEAKYMWQSALERPFRTPVFYHRPAARMIVQPGSPEATYYYYYDNNGSPIRMTRGIGGEMTWTEKAPPPQLTNLWYKILNEYGRK